MGRCFLGWPFGCNLYPDRSSCDQEMVWTVRQKIDVPNADFSGGFSNWKDIGELTVAEWWSPWWKEEDPPIQGVNHRPEYKPETMRFERGQKLFTTFSTHQCGIYQRVRVPEDARDFELFIDCQYLSKHTDGSGGGLGMRCGLDPTGGTDPYSEAIRWGSWHGQDDKPPWDGNSTETLYAPLRLVAPGQWLTIWLESRCRFAAKWNDAYFDNVQLFAEFEEEPSPDPDPEPSPELIESLGQIRDELKEIRIVLTEIRNKL